jgi:lycopene beta-cyclase
VKSFDLIIIGGGCAGLSLCSRLIKQGYRGSVAVLEPRTDYEDDRSWCFWGTGREDFIHLTSHRWGAWRFARKGCEGVKQSADGIGYYYIRGLDFYRHGLDLIASSDNVTLETDYVVTHLKETEDQVEVATFCRQRFSATYVIDTRPPNPVRKETPVLYQCFYGAEVDTSLPGIGEDCAGLMTDVRAVNEEIAFSYVLPLSYKRTLLEATRFSRPATLAPARRDLEIILEEKGLSRSSIIREEHGILPMGMPLEKPNTSRRIFRAGIGGGALRASTGYGFCRIQAWAKACSQSLLATGNPISQAPAGIREHFMDTLFLNVLRNSPEAGVDILEALFSRTDPENLVDFLTENHRLASALNIIRHLPPKPFLREMVSMTLPQWYRNPGNQRAPR